MVRVHHNLNCQHPNTFFGMLALGDFQKQGDGKEVVKEGCAAFAYPIREYAPSVVLKDSQALCSSFFSGKPL
jgi:hypothetical protein